MNTLQVGSQVNFTDLANKSRKKLETLTNFFYARANHSRYHRGPSDCPKVGSTPTYRIVYTRGKAQPQMREERVCEKWRTTMTNSVSSQKWE
jgi:hypothetical protein